MGSLVCVTGTSGDSCDVINASYLVECAAENKLDLVRSILRKHPDKVCPFRPSTFVFHRASGFFSGGSFFPMTQSKKSEHVIYSLRL